MLSNVSIFILAGFIIAYFAIISKLNKSIALLHSQQVEQNAKLSEQILNISHQANSVQLQQLTSIQSSLAERVEGLVKITEQKLSSGFDRTSQTFTSIMQRLSLIDKAQTELAKLSSEVISLQKLLNDKSSRGAFGEIQLNNLIKNMLPKENFALQHNLSNGTRCDCMLYLPEPTGNLAIDAKFPLENFQRMTREQLSNNELEEASKLFRNDVKKHINDIAKKYIIPGETGDGAIMFIPAESIFAEIHSNHRTLVEYSYEKKVWLASPTTMMAILTTASSVLKEVATQKHVKIIKEHLNLLSKDFARFELRVQKLAKHINLANEDVQQVQTSAHKLTNRFKKISHAELEKPTSVREAT